MKLEGIHHITAITEDAQRNVDFYAGVLGLRLVKKTVNQDNPTVYHLFFADEGGDPGSDLTFFEYPGVASGRPGAGMVHRVVWRVASEDSLAFWADRLAANGIESEREGAGLVFSDPEGLDHELLVVDVPDAPLIADHPDVPGELALQGFHAVRAYSVAPEASSGLLEALEFEQVDGAWEARGEKRGGRYLFDEPPPERGLQGAGSVHHVAWASLPEEHMEWRDEGDFRGRAADPGDRPLLLQVDLLPRAQRRPLRDRHDGARLHRRRAARAPRREALAATRLRAHAGRSRAQPATGEEPPHGFGGVNGDFIWRDAGRTVVFRHNGVAQAAQLLREHDFEPFELLTTSRGVTAAAGLAEEAEAVHVIPTGAVPELAATLVETAASKSLVALGGGRPIDVAKAVASVTGARVAAIPTTMSGAEMTGIHRLPAGAEARVASMVRPALVIADPAAMTSQPEAGLRASAMNALAHGADSLYTPFANPVSEMSALRGAELIATSLDHDPEERSRSSLALGSLLCGYAIDSGMFGVHHVVCQTLVRVCGTPHAETNAAILPRALALLVARAPERLADLAAAIATDPEDIEARVLQLGGNPAGLGAIGADRAELDQALEAMAARPELAFVPGPPLGKSDLAELVEARLVTAGPFAV